MSGEKSFRVSILFAIAAWVLPIAGAPAAAATLQLFVDANASGIGATGSKNQPFKFVKDAVDVGRLQSAIYSDIKITLLPGQHTVTLPVLLDYPVKLQGSNAPVYDAAGRPTGTVPASSESRITAAAGFGNQAVISVQPAAGSASVTGVSVSLVTLQRADSAAAAIVKLKNAQSFTVSDVLIRGTGAAAGVDAYASSGYVKKVYVSNVSACGICLAGGTPISPAYVYVIQNRSVTNQAGALLLTGTTKDGSTLTAQVNNNALSENAVGRTGSMNRQAA